jgi:tetratricopeptide (TPR) repeat protein
MSSPAMTVRALPLWICISAAAVTGCGGRDAEPLPGSTPNSQSSPHGGASPEAAIATPGGASAPAEVAIEKGAEPALKLTGIGSKEELDRSLAQLEDPTARAEFEKGFRLSFSHDRAHRRFAEAVAATEKVLAISPDFPPAYRVLAYAHFNLSFDMPKATEYYEKAVALDPNYGEAHYALAFMLTQSDTARARTHFDKAIALGVPDERNLREQFFR